MSKRFVTIWFRHLKTDWYTRHQPGLSGQPLVLVAPDHGRMVVTAVNALAQSQGIYTDMVAADARALLPGLQVLDDKPGSGSQLLKNFACWCIRYTPIATPDPPDGLILDATGCTHLWGSEKKYLTEINMRFKNFGYHVRISMADTIGAAWANTRFGTASAIIESNRQKLALLTLPPAALRLEPVITERLEKLGLRQVQSFMGMPRGVLRRRFGEQLIKRLDQALGHEDEPIIPIEPVAPYQERLPCLEPICTATGIEIALRRLLETLCLRLRQEQKGLRMAIFKCYRVDGKTIAISIGTHRASHHISHLFKLFELKLPGIEPALGIELFILEAPKVEEVFTPQEKLWEGTCGLGDTRLAEMIDRLSNKIGAQHIHRYLPDAHHWPERSVKQADSLCDALQPEWVADKSRPIHLLSKPVCIEVTAPIPDYPPMLFRYKGKLHKIKKADGPERIEQEWWIAEGQHRDYYRVEDEEGHRYWLFRSGHYSGDKTEQWFLHGFFA